MTRPVAKGWCPGAYRPMMSGDGLVVRVRPIMARLTRDQVLGLCEAAIEFGSGIIDLTSRANLQIRGVPETSHEPLLQRLNTLGLLPDDPDLEARRNILVYPLWRPKDETTRLAAELTARLGEFPDMPAKIGYAIDTGAAPVFTRDPADFRLERTASGELLLRADGMSRGQVVSVDDAIDALIALAHWFVDTGGADHRRMANHVSFIAPSAERQAALPAAPAGPPSPGDTPMGAVFGAAFGQINAARLIALVEATKARGLRVTPWRLFLLEHAEPVETSDFITANNDPLLTVEACPGMPMCPAASVATHALARAMAGKTSRRLHISGCAKGCAHPRAADLTLVGDNGQFNLVRNGAPWDEPAILGLDPKTLPDRIGEL